MTTLIIPEKKLKAPASYPELREQIRRTIEAGERHAEAMLQEMSARTFWQVGRSIDLYLKSKKGAGGRAPYGEKVIVKLAEELDYKKSMLYDALLFARQNPIFHPGGKLSSKHLRLLLRVTDEKQKLALASQAQKHGWGTRQLEKQVKQRTFVLKPRKGKLHHYRVVERNGEMFLDFGFRDWRRIPPETQALAELHPGDIIEGTSFQTLAKKKDAVDADLYTYRAEIVSLPDADTHWLFIIKDFDGFRIDKIRLQGVDAPEISTQAGRRARQFVAKILGFSEKPGAKSVEVVIATTKVPDKYDRYLVDLYFQKDGEEIHLNRLLLEKGFAVPYEG